MIFGTRRHRRRRELLDAGFTDEWRRLCADRVRWWGDLDVDTLHRVEAAALELIAGADWEPANGFAITETMQVLIAVQAALLVANVAVEDPYRDVHAVIVHPSTVVLHGEHSQVDGIVSDDPTPVLGQAEYHGPVLVAWDEVDDDVHHHGDGRNVVFHEFAHKLDMLDGTLDGTPPLSSADLAARWVEVCTRVYHAVEVDEAGDVLDEYAGVSPSEFFAVATEAFFADAVGLLQEHPDLYVCLADFYRHDPATWPSSAGSRG